MCVCMRERGGGGGEREGGREGGSLCVSRPGLAGPLLKSPRRTGTFTPEL